MTEKERISIPPNNDKLWRYLTEGLSGRTSELPSYPKKLNNYAYIAFMSEENK